MDGAFTVEVRSVEDILDVLSVGDCYRTFAASAHNERSSRAHVVLSVSVRGADAETGEVTLGQLHLVDLAGAERVPEIGPTTSAGPYRAALGSAVSRALGAPSGAGLLGAARRVEARNINGSLEALAAVMGALLREEPAHAIPYRASMLTRLLRPSLSPDGRVVLFVCVEPSASRLEESVDVLRFASLVKEVRMRATRRIAGAGARGA